MSKMKLPTITEIAALVKSLKHDIGDEYRAYDDDDSNTPSMLVTIGVDPSSGAWSYQTGDNSYSGGAYGFHYWGVTSIYRRSNSRKIAKYLLSEVAEQACDEFNT